MSKNRTLKFFSLVTTGGFYIFLSVLVIYTIPYKIFGGKITYETGELKLFELKPEKGVQPVDHLKGFFNDTVHIFEKSAGSLHIRPNKANLNNKPITWAIKIIDILIPILLLSLVYWSKRLFNNLSLNKIFTKPNVNFLRFLAITFIIYPLILWCNTELILKFIQQYQLNTHGYGFSNRGAIINGYTYIGLVLLVIAEIFNAGTEIKKENDSFI